MVYEVKLISINIMPSLWLKLQRSKPIVRRIQKHIFLTRHVKPSAQACHDPQTVSKPIFWPCSATKTILKFWTASQRLIKRLIVILKVILHKMLPGQFHLVWREQPALYVLIVASQVTLLLIVGN